MSIDDQQTLDAFNGAQTRAEVSVEMAGHDHSPYRSDGESAHEDDDEALPERPNRCQNCAHPIPLQTRRVFGDNRNVMWACYECSTIEDIRAGAAVTGGSDA